jgi:PAS domain-containing protein
MSATRPTPTGRESPLGEDEIIVTKTDTRGRIAYANEVFLRVSALTWQDAIGAPHSLVRHPAMPRCVFELMWKTIQSGGEFFGYVLNLATNGDHYWVFAHVTPSFGPDGKVSGFHSNRRKPEARQVASVSALYRDLLAVEQRVEDRKRGQQMGSEALAAMLAEKGMSYDRFAFAL